MIPLQRLLAARLNALASGDRSLVVECEAQLARLGFTPDAESPLEVAVPAVTERAAPRRITRTR